MFGGLIYRYKAMQQLMALTLMIGAEGQQLRRVAWIKQAIKKHRKEGYPPDVAATHVAAALIGTTIRDSTDNDRKALISQQLQVWAKTENPRSMRRDYREGRLGNQDALLTRLQWMLLMAADALEGGTMTQHDYDILKDEIYGSLADIPYGDLANARLSNMVDNVFGAARARL